MVDTKYSLIDLIPCKIYLTPPWPKISLPEIGQNVTDLRPNENCRHGHVVNMIQKEIQYSIKSILILNGMKQAEKLKSR